MPTVLTEVTGTVNWLGVPGAEGCTMHGRMQLPAQEAGNHMRASGTAK